MRKRWEVFAAGWIAAWAGLFTVPAAEAADRSAKAGLTVATYNLRLNVASDGADAWPLRKDAVVALIRRHDIDLFGTQEALPGQIADMAALNEYDHVGVGRDDGVDAGEHSAIFYRRARFELLDHGDFWFSETPDRPSKGWDARCCNRLASWVRLRDKPSGKTLAVVSVHFDHEGEVARRHSADMVLQWVAKQRADDHVIALGDFNSAPDTPQIVAMQRAMRDAKAVSTTPPEGPDGTFNGFKFGAPPGERIDYIFLGPRLAVQRYAVLTDAVGEHYPSDHFPVLARISFE